MSATGKNPKVKFGLLLPTREAVMSNKEDPARELYRLAERAEALNFHSVWVGDSITARPRLEALTTLAAVSARTRRVRLGTAVLLAALRHPIHLALMTANLDRLSGGRVILGIGYGRPQDPAQQREFEALGLSTERRIKMSEEVVHLLRRLWREENVSHEGSFTRFHRVTLQPKPVQPGGVPIWLASNNVEPGLKRVARMGDGWLNNITSPQLYRECLAKIRQYAADAGRDPLAIEPSAYLTVAGGSKETVNEAHAFLARYYNRPYEAVAKAMVCIVGSWEEVLDAIEAYLEAGAQTVILRFAAADQIGHLEACAGSLARRGLLSDQRERVA